VLLFVLLGLLSGCAGRLKQASDLYYRGEPQQALTLLEKGDTLGQRNELLFLMEKGIVQHRLGDFRASILSLLEAGGLIEDFETISISEQAGALVVNEWMQRYKGEYAERLWVHTYLMMDYLLLGEFDDAQVEARRALERFEQYPEALEKDYFTRALMALCFSHQGEDNDAFILYKKLATDIGPEALAADLVALAARIGMPDEVDNYRPYLAAEPLAGEAELVVFVASGRIPLKQPGNVVLPPLLRFSFPYYGAVGTPQPRLTIAPASLLSLPVVTTDLTTVAKAALEARKLQIIVRETARVAGKEALSQKLGDQYGGGAELVVRLGLMLLEEPDTRSWRTLPGRLSLLRIPLQAGRHQLEITTGDGAGSQLIPSFEIRSGERIFRSLRF
jgi:hypothetical protein